MPSLDCHNVDSTLTSIGTLLSTDRCRLRAALMGFPFSEFEASRPHPDDLHDPPRVVLWNRIVGPGATPPIPDVTYWFHATRVPPGTDFAEGIQPLGERLPAIKAFLATLAGQLDLPPASQETATSFWGQQGGFQSSLKAPCPLHWGPFAFLVRDAILQRASSTHDYLATPEIVEDLAGIMAGDSAPRLIDEFRKATKPCIVKFRCAEPRADVVEVALFYSYSTLWGQEQSIETNTCFDSEGRSIPFSDIAEIEYPDSA